LASRYRPGQRTDAWIKIKPTASSIPMHLTQPVGRQNRVPG